jgi:hypothetical protein
MECRCSSDIYQRLNVQVTIYGIFVCSIKVAILTEWKQIFVVAGTRNAFWWTGQVLIVLNVVYYTAGVIFNQFICSPREKIWDKTILGGHCVDNNISDITAGVINLVSDVVILILPQSIIWKLDRPLKDRLGLAFMFCIGVL